VGASASPLPSSLHVVPGDEAGCEIKIRNTGTVVDQFTFEVLGDAAAWAQVSPPSLNLLPGAEGSIQLQLRPPRQPTTKAGSMPLGLKVISKEDPQHSAFGNGLLDIGAYRDLTAQIVPHTSHARRSAEHRLTIVNMGNEPVGATLAARDPDDLLAFEIDPQALTVEPGTTGSAVVRVQARNTLVRGREQPRPFQVLVQAPGSPPITAEGTLTQQPLLPSWLVFVLVGVIALILASSTQHKVRWIMFVVAAAAAGLALAQKLLRSRAKASKQPPLPR
jgi:hypothetical protein